MVLVYYSGSDERRKKQFHSFSLWRVSQQSHLPSTSSGVSSRQHRYPQSPAPPRATSDVLLFLFVFWLISVELRGGTRLFPTPSPAPQPSLSSASRTLPPVPPNLGGAEHHSSPLGTRRGSVFFSQRQNQDYVFHIFIPTV